MITPHIAWAPLEARHLSRGLADTAVADDAHGLPRQLHQRAVPEAVLDRRPGIRYVGLLSTGYNVVDTAAAREKGIPVCNVPGYGANL